MAGAVFASGGAGVRGGGLHLFGRGADAGVQHELFEGLQDRDLVAADDGTSGGAGACTRGVSAGRATTSNTTCAACTSGSGKARSCASGPPLMPMGVMLTRTSACTGSGAQV